jgi:hypothetical protein
VNRSRPSPRGRPEPLGRTQRVPGAAGPVAVRPPEAASMARRSPAGGEGDDPEQGRPTPAHQAWGAVAARRPEGRPRGRSARHLRCTNYYAPSSGRAVFTSTCVDMSGVLKLFTVSITWRTCQSPINFEASFLNLVCTHLPGGRDPDRGRGRAGAFPSWPGGRLGTRAIRLRGRSATSPAAPVEAGGVAPAGRGGRSSPCGLQVSRVT